MALVRWARRRWASSERGTLWPRFVDVAAAGPRRRGIVIAVELADLDGVLAHPVSDEQVIAFVTYGKAKLANLRSRPWATIVFRAGWQWVSAEGRCDIIGPDDPFPGLDPAALPELLRAVFRAAGGAHDDWETFDRVMRDERRSAVLLRAERIYSNRS